jgi:hypothetical protein
MGRFLFIQKTDPDFVDHVDSGTLTINQAYVVLKKMSQKTPTLLQKSVPKSYPRIELRLSSQIILSNGRSG